MIQIKGGLYSVILAITLFNTNLNDDFKSENINYKIKQLGYQKTDSLDYFAENGFGKPVQSIQPQ